MNLEHKIIEVIEEKRLKLFRHLKRIRSNRIPKQLHWSTILKVGGERRDLGTSRRIEEKA